MELRLDNSDVKILTDSIIDRVPETINDRSPTGLMDVGQLSEYLGVPKGWIYDRTRISEDAGGIPHYKIGKYVRFNLEEVLKWLKKQ